MTEETYERLASITEMLAEEHAPELSEFGSRCFDDVHDRVLAKFGVTLEEWEAELDRRINAYLATGGLLSDLEP